MVYGVALLIGLFLASCFDASQEKYCGMWTRMCFTSEHHIDLMHGHTFYRFWTVFKTFFLLLSFKIEDVLFEKGKNNAYLWNVIIVPSRIYWMLIF